MDHTLRELEKAFCAGLVSRRDFFRRAAFLLAGTTAAFELLGRLSPRRLAWASPGCISLDLSITDLASQGYISDGSQPFAVDTVARRLTITDASAADCRNFVKACPEIPISAIEVGVTVSLHPQNLSPQGEDSGVHAVLIEG